MVRRRNLPTWQYGIISSLALITLLELVLAVFNLRNELFWNGMNNLLVASSCTLLGISTLYEVKRRSHPVAYLAYLLAALGVASLIVTWVIS